ncbi:MAG: hypothetical protein AAB091_07260 [Elusimicrobiota bacterium]
MKWCGALFLLLTFSYDITIDGFDRECRDANASVCHACICQAHAANAQSPNSQIVVPRQSQRIVLNDPNLFKRIFDKSYFHPPKPLS